jgi:Domain of unknown function (DUF4258)
MANLRLLFTQHAEEMLVERRIDRGWVEATIRNPHALEADPNRSGVFRAFSRIAERDGRFLRVVYAPSGETVRVLTVFFDRRRKR